jgi:spore coat polysaccharide biosynthesis predicted glycosyltransferase SpsG
MLEKGSRWSACLSNRKRAKILKLLCLRPKQQNQQRCQRRANKTLSLAVIAAQQTTYDRAFSRGNSFSLPLAKRTQKRAERENKHLKFLKASDAFQTASSEESENTIY